MRRSFCQDRPQVLPHPFNVVGHVIRAALKVGLPRFGLVLRRDGPQGRVQMRLHRKHPLRNVVCPRLHVGALRSVVLQADGPAVDHVVVDFHPAGRAPGGPKEFQRRAAPRGCLCECEARQRQHALAVVRESRVKMYELKVVCRLPESKAHTCNEQPRVSSCGEASRPHRCGRGDCRLAAEPPGVHTGRRGAPRPAPAAV